MPDPDLCAFQEALAISLQERFEGSEVQQEWRTMAGNKDVYSPRLDIAVGPFATGDLICIDDYDALAAKHSGFLAALHAWHAENCERFGEHSYIAPLDEVAYRNRNARCFLAIEIENKVSRKHLMGGAINAAALGRIGIAVGWSEKMVRAFVKLRSYLLYLASVDKNTFHPYNLLILSQEQLAEAVQQSLGPDSP